ncbi:MAG: hypothetical protein KME54_02795 [Tolypothrix brevis GSE-NOS-MK-07-07A]|nr:hypothetical protein [Tolypothrix brevis GSE-NOS-MK-07-07A]
MSSEPTNNSNAGDRGLLVLFLAVVRVRRWQFRSNVAVVGVLLLLFGVFFFLFLLLVFVIYISIIIPANAS